MFISMPIVDEKAPRECDLDAMVEELRTVDTKTACVFNCQVHKSCIQVLKNCEDDFFLTNMFVFSDGEGSHNNWFGKQIKFTVE